MKTKQPSPTEAYKYCPCCSGVFQHKGENWLKCKQCGYDFFINAAPLAGLLVLNSKQEVLLVKRQGQDAWNIPGGFMLSGETISETLHREVEERLGLKLELGDYAGNVAGVFDSDGAQQSFLGIYYTAKLPDNKVILQDKHGEVAFFSLDQLDFIPLLPVLRGLIGKILATKDNSSVAQADAA